MPSSEPQDLELCRLDAWQRAKMFLENERMFIMKEGQVRHVMHSESYCHY